MIPKILYMYFFKQVLKSFIVVLLSFYIILFALQIIDLTSRLEVDILIIITMSFNRIFTTLFNMMPMITLLAFILAFNTMNKSNEIIISRSSGISMIQFFSPAIILGLLIGTVYTTILQPRAIDGMAIYDKLWNQSKKYDHTTVKISETGLWLKESAGIYKYRIINSQKVNEHNFKLYNNEIIEFNKKSNKIVVYRTNELMLEDNNWILKNPTKFTNGKIQIFESLKLPTKTSKEHIKKLFTSVDKINFWELQNYINQLKKSELNTNEATAKFHFLLSMPLFFVAIVFIAGFFAAKPTIRNSNKKNIRNGIIAGFILYFYINSAKFLVFISNINPHILGWIPAITMLFIGIFLLFSTEKITR